MIPKFLISAFFVLIVNQSFGQDFEFTWRIETLVKNSSFLVKISQSNTFRENRIYETFSSDSIIKKMKAKDCDSLIKFINSYSFPLKGNYSDAPNTREYFDTKFLKDTNWIVLGNDTLRKELQVRRGYIYDKDSNKYYQEIINRSCWTDGTIYSGEFISKDFHKRYSVYCTKLTKTDYLLNNFMYSLMKKYSGKNYSQLGEVISSDYPEK